MRVRRLLSATCAIGVLPQTAAPNCAAVRHRIRKAIGHLEGTIFRDREKIERLQSLLVDFSGEKSNQIFDELANWEEVLKGSSLLKPAPPAL